MEKANELLQLVMEDSRLENTNEKDINTLIDVSRRNLLFSKLLLLARNSVSAKKSIIDCINKACADPSNDFRIFVLLLVLSDGDCLDEALDLSRTFTTSTKLRTTRLIAINILLKESMYGTKN